MNLKCYDSLWVDLKKLTKRRLLTFIFSKKNPRLMRGFFNKTTIYSLSASSAKYSATPSGDASIPLSPSCQPAGHTSP